MDKEMVQKIEGIIQVNKGDIPAGFKLWEERKKKGIETDEELLRILFDLFAVEEKAIEREQNAPYVTDNYENNVRFFALCLMQELIPTFERFKSEDAYLELLCQKHMAYSFYNLMERGEEHEGLCMILGDEKYGKGLYLGLLKFYSAFYGRFSDNEEAIRLICKYYPTDEDAWLEQEKVIEALFSHITNAGDYGDLGYAYQGIEQIQKYIKNLPCKIIRQLLKRYHLYDIVNQKVYRHQIHAIIKSSCLEEEKKPALKFFYLDSLLLADFFNFIFVDKKRKLGDDIQIYLNVYEKNMADKEISVLKKPKAYWDNDDENPDRRLFWADGENRAEIYFKGEFFVFVSEGRSQKFNFDIKDWVLENLCSKASHDQIRQLISDGNDDENDIRQMTYSYLYLNGYRGTEEQILDFDHRFIFYSDNKELKPQASIQKEGLHFYGKSVYSLTCIVGKNGTGKTSIIDFLREKFYIMLKMLEDSMLPCENGYIDKEYCRELKLLGGECTFLVVFRVGDKDYFLTNMKDIKKSGVLPYQKEICNTMGSCKVAYFSQQLQADRILFLEKKGEGETGISKTLAGLGQCDYSEIKSIAIKRNAINASDARKEIINRELCYQFSLLRHIETNKLVRYLEISGEKRLAIYNLLSGGEIETFSFEDCKDTSKLEALIEEYAKRQDVGIGFFSSGQYAKFVFLARLYWFLRGYNEDSQYYQKDLTEQTFLREDALQQEESALIFIDEGELYYHPEWQRRYVSTLLDMLSLCEGGARVQIVFTTNSPFVISDVLKEDVQYLSDSRTEFGETLGQNIHILLKRNFFMDYTIGEYSRRLIETIIRWIEEKDKNQRIEQSESNERREMQAEEKTDISFYFDNVQDEYEMVEHLIQQIGEPVYRNKLEGMLRELREHKENSLKNRIFQLEQQKADLEKKIAELKEEGEYDSN